MTLNLLTALGGVGLFLIGMDIMTGALREAAGPDLRRMLGRFTASPLRGTLTGAVATGALQSSTAVTLMTIGAVGAGLLSFAHALGVLYGANIGTTLTGWIVMILGFKLKLGTAVLPVIFVAALAAMLAHGWVARAARALAGFCLLFIGLDMMQGGLDGADALLHPEMLPDGDGWSGRLMLVGLGVILVTLTQSSSAGIALTLVLLGAGSITFAQGAALVIGLNVGTTLTAVLAALGGTRAMRLTALGNLLFNIGTALMAFPLLGLIAPVLHGTWLGSDDQTALVLFHTGFNLLGAAVFLPLTPRFAAMVEALVPDRPMPMATPLDKRLLADEGAAMEAAQTVADQLRQTLFTALANAIGPDHDLRALGSVSAQGAPVLEALGAYLAKIHIPPDKAPEQARYVALLHQLDHLERLLERCGQRSRIDMLRKDPLLTRDVAAIRAALARDADAARFSRLARLIRYRAERFRRGALLREHAGLIEVDQVFARTDAIRWLERVAGHAERLSHYAAEARTHA
ncbi:phosphate:Na+ symporter [Roseovarius halotolerans]|uniref:Na+/Pi-cotransporter n=1 Tax=Roseovarius halotolerans TaxID=505353 RepID=A0A1X6Z5J3_9RHOB|nr:Na/Pi symporter [Roseovarius halotolerans]RKT32167.1 phosphate:Na+ symporter [Roseovarius halotolerans]SLN41177.1 Na+/Pi-cotransporter [Roseovarius halotolerans]